MNAYISSELCTEKMKTHDERFKRDKERADKFELNIEKLNEAAVLLTKMIEVYSKEINKQEQRLLKIENRPLDLWNKLIGGIIGAVSGGLAAYLIAALTA